MTKISDSKEQKMKLKNKILIGIISILLVLILSASIIMYFEIRESTELMVTDRLSDQVKSMALVIK